VSIFGVNFINYDEKVTGKKRKFIF